ncbi:MAG: hypothetical protein FWC50_12835 [Planctomycetaceae bacterium]|nr:hypothetical protein [Planctomycetaceae bacterium]
MPVSDFVAETSGRSKLLFAGQMVKEPITVLGQRGTRTTINGETVYFIEEGCRIQQGNDRLEASHAVIWERLSNQNVISGDVQRATIKQITVYLESAAGEPVPSVEISGGSTSGVSSDRSWIGNLTTTAGIDIRFSTEGTPVSRLPDIYSRANLARRPTSVGTHQYYLTADTASTFTSGTTTSGMSATNTTSDSGVQGLSINSRSDTPMTFQWEHFPEINQSRLIIEQGVMIVVSGLPRSPYMMGDTIDISADRVIIWTANIKNLYDQMQQTGQKLSVNNLDLELYLEGNVIFREGDRVIYADRMYYDVKNSVGKILNAEMITPVPQYDGVIRLKADTVQRTGFSTFTADNSLLTTSEMGTPGYSLRSRNLQFEEKRIPVINTLTGEPILNPATGTQYEDRRRYVVSEQNVIEIGGVPVFYWPWLAFNAEQPVMYLKRAEYFHDDMFGHQARTRWDLYQLLNMRNHPEGTTLDLNLDYLTKRGLGHGIQFAYNRDSVFGIPSQTVGLADYWGIYDTGKDNLGLNRRSLEPETDYRYRAFWQHKQYFQDDWLLGQWLGKGWLLTAELGTSSDRNFLPQYFEKEWKTFKDENTGLELRKIWENNQSLSLSADYSIDKFYTRTDSLPRLDHYTIGYSPFSNMIGDTLTWYEHTHVGLQSFNTTTSPEDPNDLAMFRYLPWETAPGSTLDPNDPNTKTLSATRETFATRHEIDMPFQLGAVKCVPYLMGEFAHWGEARDGDSLDRLLGTAGFRADLPFWKVNPNYSSEILYVNGIAHKVNTGFDFSYTTVNKHYDKLIMYDQIDDNSVEDFRRRYSVTTFGGTIPLLYDERYYAIRSGLGNWVTSPSTEIADDLVLFRTYFNQTWQTKRGPTVQRRIVDWITLDTGVNFYPKKEQNFGETVGLIDYDFKWHVGDRFSVLSSGLFDTFNSGQTILRLGGMLQRPERGSLYLGVDRLDGPFKRTYLNGSVAYNLSEKWAAEYSTSFDLDKGRNMGQNFALMRKGESFLVRLGANYDWSRDVWGVSFSVQPVFLSRLRTSTVVPPLPGS